MATFPVKYINNAMRGAPQLSGTAGTLIAVLDAFLITGFGQVTALSVNVAGGIATASLQSGQSFEQDRIVLVDGATPAALNGEARVLVATNSSITWATAAPDGAATGSITIKYAPAGQWEKKYTGTNKAAYRSTDPQASGFFLRVDDAGTTGARVRGFLDMTDVDTGSGPFPTDAQSSGGGYWWKSFVANATAVRYDLIADSRALLLAIGAGASSNSVLTASPLRGFGDMVALAPGGDGFAVALSCGSGVSNAQNFSNGTFDYVEAAAGLLVMARPPSGIGGAHSVGTRSYVSGGSGQISGVDGVLGGFPSQIDGQLKFSRRYVHSGDGATPRADVPGVLHVPQTGVLSLVAPRDTFVGDGDMAGRTLLALAVNGNSPSAAPTGIVLVDITGPWR